MMKKRIKIHYEPIGCKICNHYALEMYAKIKYEDQEIYRVGREERKKRVAKGNSHASCACSFSPQEQTLCTTNIHELMN